MTDQEFPDWCQIGAKVVIVRSSMTNTGVILSTIQKVTKTQIVVANDDRRWRLNNYQPSTDMFVRHDSDKQFLSTSTTEYLMSWDNPKAQTEILSHKLRLAKTQISKHYDKFIKNLDSGTADELQTTIENWKHLYSKVNYGEAKDFAASCFIEKDLPS